ncbi:TLP1 [Symbiodinium sp. CCMP2592]|nr:TLP1 [Symbiodinium sp. CCMP2592]
MRSRWLLWVAWPCYCREFLQSDLGDVSPLPKLPPLPKSPPLPLVSHHRLVVHNGCDKEDVWIGHMAGTTTGPDPQNVKIPPGGSYNFTTPDGQTSTRYWPKFGCDADGNKCVIGDSGGPQQICRSDGCSPPVDTKFEATFGVSGLPCSPLEGMREGCDWVDISLVDGYTVPFKFEIHGSCWDADGHLMNASAKSVDCSRLSVDDCPKDETFHTFDSAGNATVDLQVRHPAASTAAGCYSPCSKLTLNQWASFSTTQYNMDVFSREYCCPTPPVSPAACRAGSVKWSKYVGAIHHMCPGVYGYSYDDGMGLVTCQATSTYFFTVGCPSSGTAASAQVPKANSTKRHQIHDLPRAHVEKTIRQRQRLSATKKPSSSEEKLPEERTNLSEPEKLPELPVEKKKKSSETSSEEKALEQGLSQQKLPELPDKEAYLQKLKDMMLKKLKKRKLWETVPELLQ